MDQRRKEHIEEPAKEEKREASKKFGKVVAWVKADQSDQSLILDCITEEASRYLGGCEWILKIDHMKP